MMNPNVFILLLVILSVVLPHSLATYDKSKQPGTITTWTFNKGVKRDQSIHSQTLEAPAAIASFEKMSVVPKNTEVLALLKMHNGESILDNQHVMPVMNAAPLSSSMSSVYRTEHTGDQSRPIHNELAESHLFRDAKEMTVSEFKEFLMSSHRPMTNGKLDSVVVSVHNTEADLPVLQEITAMGQSARPVSIMAVREPSLNAFAPKQQSQYSRILATDTIDGASYSPEGSEYSIYYQAQYLYITPDIFTGLLTMLFVVFVILIGLSCMGSIQGSSTFTNKMPVIGREA